MATIFPREEKAEQLFEKILENPDACERLKDTFYEHFPESEDAGGIATDFYKGVVSGIPEQGSVGISDGDLRKQHV